MDTKRVLLIVGLLVAVTGLMMAMASGTPSPSVTTNDIIEKPPRTVGTAAIPCTVGNCATCDTTNPSVCTTCNPGYIIDRLFQCMLIGSCNVANCETCVTNDNRRCKNCVVGYQSTASYMCIPLQATNAASRTCSLALSGAMAVVNMALAMS